MRIYIYNEVVFVKIDNFLGVEVLVFRFLDVILVFLKYLCVWIIFYFGVLEIFVLMLWVLSFNVGR